MMADVSTEKVKHKKNKKKHKKEKRRLEDEKLLTENRNISLPEDNVLKSSEDNLLKSPEAVNSIKNIDIKAPILWSHEDEEMLLLHVKNHCSNLMGKQKNSYKFDWTLVEKVKDFSEVRKKYLILARAYILFQCSQSPYRKSFSSF